MTTTEWNGENFRRQMHNVERSSENYAAEHSLKLRKGVPSGRVGSRDEAKGEAFAASVIGGSSTTEDRDALLEFLDELLVREVSAFGIEDADAYRRGFLARVRQTRAGIISPAKPE